MSEQSDVKAACRHIYICGQRWVSRQPDSHVCGQREADSMQSPFRKFTFESNASCSEMTIQTLTVLHTEPACSFKLKAFDILLSGSWNMKLSNFSKQFDKIQRSGVIGSGKPLLVQLSQKFSRPLYRWWALTSPSLQPFIGICLMPRDGRKVTTKVTARNSTVLDGSTYQGGKFPAAIRWIMFSLHFSSATKY